MPVSIHEKEVEWDYVFNTDFMKIYFLHCIATGYLDNVHLMLVNPRVTAKSKSPIITTPPPPPPPRRNFKIQPAKTQK